MTNIIILKNSNTAYAVPNNNDLQVGELAINLVDQKIYSKNSSNTVFQIAKSANDLNLNGLVFLTSNSHTISNSSSNQIIDEFSSLDYRGAKLTISGFDLNANSFQFTEILIVHDNTNTYMTEYGSVWSNGSIGDFSSEISANTVKLLFTPINNDVELKILRANIDV